jgi:PAS domain S-box-containing protein
MAREKKSFSPNARMAALVLLEAAFLAGIWWGVNRQLDAMNYAVNEISELKDPSPFRAALTGHLGKIHLGLEGVFSGAEPSLADQVAESRKDFEAALPEFQKQNPRLFPAAAVEEISRTFGVFTQSIDHALNAHTNRVKTRSSLDENFARLLSSIERNIKPLIRNDQADGEERRDAILNVENQARAWQQNLIKAWTQPSQAANELTFENDNRGETYLERYGRLELLPRERKVLKEIRPLWDANSRLARESFAMEKVFNEAKTFMDAQRAQVGNALTKHLPAMPPAELEARKNGYVRAIRFGLIGAAVLGLFGVVSFLMMVIGAYRLKRGDRLWGGGKPAPSKAAPAAPPVHPPEPEPTLQMDLKGLISHWSAAAETLYGYSASEMRGKSVAKLFESETEISRLYKDLMENPQTVFQTTHKAKNGTIFRVQIEFRPVMEGPGKTVAIGLICSRR